MSPDRDALAKAQAELVRVLLTPGADAPAGFDAEAIAAQRRALSDKHRRVAARASRTGGRPRGWRGWWARCAAFFVRVQRDSS